MNRENQSEKSWDLQKWTIWFLRAIIFIHLLCNTTQSAAQVALKFAACKCVGKIACCCSQTYFPMYTVYIHSLLQYIHSCMFVWKFDLGFRCHKLQNCFKLFLPKYLLVLCFLGLYNCGWPCFPNHSVSRYVLFWLLHWLFLEGVHHLFRDSPPRGLSLKGWCL